MAKAFHIDAAKREIFDVIIADGDDEPMERLKELQAFVGGPLERAGVMTTGDFLLVDEEGLMKPQEHFFRLASSPNPQPLAGNGLVIGPDRYTDEGEFLGQRDVFMSRTMLEREVIWITREQADAWGKANASEPSVSITSIGKEGSIEQVFERFGQTFGNIPRQFTCPICGFVSHNPHDAEQRYCVRCHLFVDDPRKGDQK